jgi:lipoate-protein ligase A
MALDEALVESVAAGGAPTLRFYAWSPPAVSFGYAQDPAREADLGACRALGLDLVRRPTGGRAVLHWQELTYSVICRPDDERTGGRIEHTYRRIGECLVAGLRLFGVDAELEKAQVRQLRPKGAAAALPCFSSIARWEIKCRGRKLVGSAQRRFAGAVLQHGSIIIGSAHEQLVDLLLLEESRRRVWRQRLRADSTCLEQCLGGEVNRGHLLECMVTGFGQVLDVDVCHVAATEGEMIRCRERLGVWSVNAPLDVAVQ